MRTVFLGTPEIAIPTLRAMANDAALRPVGVFTQPPARRSRRGQATSSPVGEAGLRLGLDVHEVQSVSAGAAFETLAELVPDAIVVVAFGQILKQNALDLPRYGCLNFHPSMLPRYRGAAPVQRAILDGVTESGLTIMRLVKKLDAGPILKQQAWRMDEGKDAEELLTEAGELGAPLMLDVLRSLKDGLDAMPQNDELATYAPPLEKSDGVLDFGASARELVNRVRAVKGWPKAQCWLDLPDRGETRIIVHAGTPGNADQTGKPGEVLAINKQGIVVACGRGAVSLGELQLEGKPKQSAWDVANGLRLKPGVKFRVK